MLTPFCSNRFGPALRGNVLTDYFKPTARGHALTGAREYQREVPNYASFVSEAVEQRARSVTPKRFDAIVTNWKIPKHRCQVGRDRFGLLGVLDSLLTLNSWNPSYGVVAIRPDWDRESGRISRRWPIARAMTIEDRMNIVSRAVVS